MVNIDSQIQQQINNKEIGGCEVRRRRKREGNDRIKITQKKKKLITFCLTDKFLMESNAENPGMKKLQKDKTWHHTNIKQTRED